MTALGGLFSIILRGGLFSIVLRTGDGTCSSLSNFSLISTGDGDRDLDIESLSLVKRKLFSFD